MLTEAMAVSTAEMSIIEDEKKVQEPEDDKVTQAELLANEALRLASESKRAAEKLAEIRAAIAFLQSKSYVMPQPTVSDEEKREEVPVQAVASPVAPVVVPASAYAVSLLSKPELTVSPVEQPEEKAEEAPREVIASPAASVSSPVSILKKVESKVVAKEFRFSPEVVVPAIAPKAKGAVVPSSKSGQSDDEPLIIKFCDALGMDRLCSLEIDNEEMPLTRDEKIAYIKSAFQMESANGGYIGVVRTSPHVAPEADSVPESTLEAAAPSEEAAVPAEEAAAPVEEVAAPAKQAVAAPVKQAAAPAKQVAAAPAEEAKPVEKADLTVDTSSDVVSEAGEGVLSPIKMQILANAIVPTVIHQADPFAGELDDMDYGMTCGWGA
jgi:hypothetical protein